MSRESLKLQRVQFRSRVSIRELTILRAKPRVFEGATELIPQFGPVGMAAYFRSLASRQAYRAAILNIPPRRCAWPVTASGGGMVFSGWSTPAWRSKRNRAARMSSENHALRDLS